MFQQYLRSNSQTLFISPKPEIWGVSPEQRYLRRSYCLIRSPQTINNISGLPARLSEPIRQYAAW